MGIDANGKLTPPDSSVFKLQNVVRAARKIETDAEASMTKLKDLNINQDETKTPLEKFALNMVNNFINGMMDPELFQAAHAEQTQLAVGMMRHLRTEMELTTPALRAAATLAGLNVFFQAVIGCADSKEGFQQMHGIILAANRALDMKMIEWLAEEAKQGRRHD